MLSYVISGPIKSRALDDTWKRSLIKLALELKNLDPNNQLIISTYPTEVSPSNDIEIVFNLDPGPDDYTSREKKRKRETGNASRMFHTTLAGLMISKCEWTIKSRIELIPNSVDIEAHLKNVAKIIDELNLKKKPAGAFLIKSFGGSVLTSHGTVLAFPDTFQIMKTPDIQELWRDAQNIFEEERKNLEKNNFPLKIEQFMGQAFMRLSDNSINYRFSTRYYFNKQIFKKEIETMRNQIVLIDEKYLYIPKSRITSKEGIKLKQLNRILHENVFQLELRFLIFRFIKKKAISNRFYVLFQHKFCRIGKIFS
jgi:hypothetical protein